ncbi:MAG: AraC family transcriptional regulator [Spirochaetota bacterium]
MTAYFDGLIWLNAAHIPNCYRLAERDFKDRYGINYVHTGTLDISYDRAPMIHVNAPVAWLSYPGVHFTYGSSDGEWDNRYINFSGVRVKRFIESGLFPIDHESPLVMIRGSERFRHAMDDLISYLADYRMNYHRAVHMLEGLLLMFVEQKATAQLPPERTQHIAELCRRISETPGHEWDFPALAANERISYSAFRRQFRDATGYAPHQFVLRSRMERAAELLMDADRGLDDIASSVGITDAYYFSRMFKRHFHVSPRVWREENRGKTG